MAILNTPGGLFAGTGFSFDPNISPNNASFAAAVRAVVGQGGYPIPGSFGTATVLGTAALANPAHKVSTTGTNGTATTAMRSDAAPALDVAASYSWTGTHTWAGPNGAMQPAITILAPSIPSSIGSAAVGVLVIQTSSGTATALFGLQVVGGTAGTANFAGISVMCGTATLNATDFEFYQTLDLVGHIFGPGLISIRGTAIQGYGPLAAGSVDMTPDTGTFNGTLNNTTSGTATVPCRWVRSGNMMCLLINTAASVIQGTSNSSSFSMGLLPAVCQPTAGVVNGLAAVFTDNGALTQANFQIQASSVISFYKGISFNAASWTNSGQKGLQGSIVIAYPLQ